MLTDHLVSYADLVREGYSDTDLTAHERAALAAILTGIADRMEEEERMSSRRAAHDILILEYSDMDSLLYWRASDIIDNI